MKAAAAASADFTKQCCATAYENDVARWLLGETFHPGGLTLTERLGRLLDLGPRKRVLDLAAGRGASALFLAERFGCEVVGVDYGGRNVEDARRQAQQRGLANRVSFVQADAERLPFPDESFDAIICECAFCLFPDKPAAAREITRLLRVDGRVGLSDLTRSRALPPELQTLLSWVACIADAQPLDIYLDTLAAAGLTAGAVERHDDVLIALADEMRRRLFGAEILVGLKKLSWPGFDFRTANALARHAQLAIRQGVLGYAIITANKGPPASSQPAT